MCYACLTRPGTARGRRPSPHNFVAFYCNNDKVIIEVHIALGFVVCAYCGRTLFACVCYDSTMSVIVCLIQLYTVGFWQRPLSIFRRPLTVLKLVPGLCLTKGHWSKNWKRLTCQWHNNNLCHLTPYTRMAYLVWTLILYAWKQRVS